MKKRAQSLKGLDIFDFVVMVAAGFADDRRVKAKRTPKEKAEVAVHLGVNEWAKVYRKEQPANFILAEHFDARSRARAIQEVMAQWEEEGSLDEEAFDARYAPRGRYTLAKSEAQRILKKASRDRRYRKAMISKVGSLLKKATHIVGEEAVPLLGDILIKIQMLSDMMHLHFASGVVVPVHMSGLPDIGRIELPEYPGEWWVQFERGADLGGLNGDDPWPLDLIAIDLAKQAFGDDDKWGLEDPGGHKKILSIAKRLIEFVDDRERESKGYTIS